MNTYIHTYGIPTNVNAYVYTYTFKHTCGLTNLDTYAEVMNT